MIPLITLFLIIASYSGDTSATVSSISSVENSEIKFIFYNKNGANFETTASENSWPIDILECNQPDGKFAIVVHGWMESCNTAWVQETVSKLHIHRGGCVACMDYETYSSDITYVKLFLKYEALSSVLTMWISSFVGQGFNPDNGFLYGFSFGGRIVLNAAQNYGVQEIGAIDTCEMAGPGFDSPLQVPLDILLQLGIDINILTQNNIDPKNSAKNVQCIHTSSDKGTLTRNCHQNWNMGNCGYSQQAAGLPPNGSHGLCPIFYNIAFDNNFMAVRRPSILFIPVCPSINEATCWPQFYKMGYKETHDNSVTGNFFAETTKNYPYNTESFNSKPC